MMVGIVSCWLIVLASDGAPKYRFHEKELARLVGLEVNKLFIDLIQPPRGAHTRFLTKGSQLALDGKPCHPAGHDRDARPEWQIYPALGRHGAS